MARFEDGKVTLIMDGKDVETLDFNNEEDRAKILNLADQGLWSSENKDKIKEWRKSAEEYEKNKGVVQKAIGFAQRLDRIRQGLESGDQFLADLEKEGIRLTKKEKTDFDDGELDPVTEKLYKKIEALENQVKSSSVNNDAATFRLQSEAAHKDLSTEIKGKFGYPKYDPDEIDNYLRVNGENAPYHSDIKKQYRLIYNEIHEGEILKAVAKYSGMSESERLEKIKVAQGLKGGGGEIAPKPFKAVTGDRDYNAAARAMLEDARASGRSFITED